MNWDPQLYTPWHERSYCIFVKVPIYRGSNSSLVITPTVTDNYFGEDGLGDNDEPLTGLVSPQTQGAVQTLLELSKKHEGMGIWLHNYCVN